MKKLNLLLTIILGITILSCSSDDNDDNGNNSNLIGTWYGISSTFNGNNSGIPDNSIVKFSSDNRVEFIYEGFGNSGEDISEFGDWTENGNTLTITWNDSDPGLENYVLEIMELNESNLTWRTEIQDEGTLIESFSKNAEIDNFFDSESLLADWEFYTQEYRNYGNFSELPYLVTGCAKDRYYRYKEDGFQDRYDYESISSNSAEDTEENGHIIRNYTCEGDVILRGSRGYQLVDGNIIEFTNSDQSISRIKIEALNEEELIVQWNDDQAEFNDWKYRIVYHKK